LVQHAAARVLTKSRQRARINPILKSLHWLPVAKRINFKILFLIFKSLNGTAPSYPTCYTPVRPLRSSNLSLLTVPKVRTKRLGEAAFGFFGPKLCNSLLDYYHGVFEKNLKTYLFSTAFMSNIDI
ncbi:hypothetical protein LDENG_00085950, partial [Lucifuga dentata]